MSEGFCQTAGPKNRSQSDLIPVTSLQLWAFGVWTMFSSAVPYKNQHYHELKKDCIRDQKLFEDPEFPATSSSLYFKKPPPGFVEWKRPGVSGASIRLEVVAPHFLSHCSLVCCRRFARNPFCLWKVSALMTWTRELWETAGLLLPAPVWLWSQTCGRRSVQVNLHVRRNKRACKCLSHKNTHGV